MKRREFLSVGLLTTAAVGVLNETAVASNPSQAETVDGCRVALTGTEVELHAPTFGFMLDTCAGLRARSWENKLSGRTIQADAGTG